MTAEGAGYEDLVVTKHGGSLIITINRPAVYNALRTQTYRELLRAVEQGADDRQVGVLVIRGTGGKAFSSGGDLGEQKTRTIEDERQHLRHAIALGAAMRNCGMPIIAAVDGFALGGGHELHLMCDLTIASSRSTFGQAGPRVGSVPIWGATQFLAAAVGEKRAREIIFMCRRYTAEEALAMGLINKVVSAEELDAEVKQWCEEILIGSPQSIRLAKTALNFSGDLLYPAFTHGMEILAQTFGSPENAEGISAFLEKRPADFTAFRAGTTA